MSYVLSSRSPRQFSDFSILAPFIHSLIGENSHPSAARASMSAAIPNRRTYHHLVDRMIHDLLRIEVIIFLGYRPLSQRHINLSGSRLYIMNLTRRASILKGLVSDHVINHRRIVTERDDRLASNNPGMIDYGIGNKPL